MKALAAVVAAAVIFSSGCQSLGGGPNEAGGTLIGGAAGGFIGSQFGSGTGQLAATALGVVIGGAIGKSIGQSMDTQDRAYTNRAIERNRTHQTTAWTNPDTRTHYDVTPVKTYQTSQGMPCREVVIGEARIGGNRKEVYGTACRQADGSWKLQ